MDLEWSKKLLETSRDLEKPGKDLEFVNLVYEMEGKCSLEVAKILMKTFFDKDDYGTQESVNSVLMSACKKVATEALLEELPRLAKEAPEWAHILVAQYTKHDETLAREICAGMTPKIIEIFDQIMENRAIMESDPRYQRNPLLYNELIKNISTL